MSVVGHLRTSCHAFHESVMRFKADIGQALLTNSDVSTRRPSGGVRHGATRSKTTRRAPGNMSDVSDMADKLAEAEKADAETVHNCHQRCRARAYTTLQPILNAALAQSARVETELADFLKTSPVLARYLAHRQSKVSCLVHLCANDWTENFHGIEVQR